MPDKYAQVGGGGSANRPNVKERQRQAAAKNRSVLRSGRTPAISREMKGALSLAIDPTLAIPKDGKRKRK